ncbi:hypothetical protein lerEdw1_008758, partial [Lerista edwardsae]
PPTQWTASHLNGLKGFVHLFGQRILRRIPGGTIIPWLQKFIQDTNLPREKLVRLMENFHRAYKRQSVSGCPASKTITEEVAKDPLMPIKYTPEELRACLTAAVLQKYLDLMSRRAFTSEQAAVVKGKLDEMQRFRTPVVDAPVAAIGSSSVLPVDSDGLPRDPVDRRIEQAVRRAFDAAAGSLRASVAGSMFSRAVFLWIRELLADFDVPAEVRKDLKKIEAASAFAAEATADAVQLSARSMAASVTVRRNTWLRHWDVDAASQSRVIGLPFKGGKLFDNSPDRHHSFFVVADPLSEEPNPQVAPAPRVLTLRVPEDPGRGSLPFVPVMYPGGYPESVLHKLGGFLHEMTPEDVKKWKVTSADVLNSLLANQPPDTLASTIIKKYTDYEQFLDGFGVFAIGTRYICLLDAEQLSYIDEDSIQNSAFLDPSGCSQTTKDGLYPKAKYAFFHQQSAHADYYNLIRPYLGGAPSDALKTLHSYKVNMDIHTFMNLRQSSLMKLTPSEVKGLLGMNVQDLKINQDKTPVKEWIELQNPEELAKMDAGFPSKIPGGLHLTTISKKLLAFASGGPPDSAAASPFVSSGPALYLLHAFLLTLLLHFFPW